MASTAVLFAREDSVYKTIPNCDVWDAQRDATKWRGNGPVIAHPPCRAWGRLRQFSNPDPGEKELAIWAIKQVQDWGGVLEHPYGSTLWKVANLPRPGQTDCYGGWTLPVFQFWWGHRAEKATWLYIVGVSPSKIPPIPLVMGEPTHVVQTRKRIGYRPHITKAEREHTPANFALWLIELATRCSVNGEAKHNG